MSKRKENQVEEGFLYSAKLPHYCGYLTLGNEERRLWRPSSDIMRDPQAT